MTTQNGIATDLRSLLSKWKLECILPHLLAEKVDTDILQMMKLSHIRLLLHNFPLGIQIRFEYYLEQWRKDIGTPFQTAIIEDRITSTSSITRRDFKADQIKQDIQNKEIQTDLIIYNSTSHNKDAGDAAGSRNTVNPISFPGHHQLDNINFEEITSDISNTFKTPRQTTPQVDLRSILSQSSCGISLIKNYRFRKRFSNAERNLLIATIVNYYLENNIEFNVQISYALERAILKMFHSEKLSFYRTTKRGRLYMRYISAKAAIKQEIGHYNESNTNVDYSALDKEENEVFDQYSVSCETMEEDNNTAMPVISDVSHYVDEDNDTIVSDNNISMEDERIKLEPENVSETSSLDSMAIVRKVFSKKQLQSKEFERPFKNFSIPWHKVPREYIDLLENKQELGKGLNAIANLIIDDLRSISTQIPIRVLRGITQQAVMRYPHSFLGKDATGNNMTTSSVPLLSRLRNRNCNLNREKNAHRFN